MQKIADIFKYKKGVRPYKFFSTISSVYILALSTVLSGIGLFPLVISYLIAANSAAFLLCVYDKGISGKDYIRVPEKIFYTVALIGGSAGLLFGMKTLRHKTQKVSFQVVLVIVMALQAYLLTLKPELLDMKELGSVKSLLSNL